MLIYISKMTLEVPNQYFSKVINVMMIMTIYYILYILIND
jgi:hypothetical protein